MPDAHETGAKSAAQSTMARSLLGLGIDLTGSPYGDPN
jgi:hypothetical protein